MTKSPHAFRSIGEVARLVGVATHVLRYWESQFPALSPVKRPDGRRYYRTEDVLLAAGLCEVLRAEGLTIRGANLLIARDKGASLRARGRARLGAALGLPDAGAEMTAEAATGAAASMGAGTRAGAEDAACAGTRPASPTRRKARRRDAAPDGALPLFADLLGPGGNGAAPSGACPDTPPGPRPGSAMPPHKAPPGARTGGAVLPRPHAEASPACAAAARPPGVQPDAAPRLARSRTECCEHPAGRMAAGHAATRPAPFAAPEAGRVSPAPPCPADDAAPCDRACAEWLARLTTISGRLRVCEAPLPDDHVRQISDALRLAAARL